MTAAVNTVNSVVSLFCGKLVRTLRLRTSEVSHQRACLGGKPIALSPGEGEKSGVRTLDDSSV